MYMVAVRIFVLDLRFRFWVEIRSKLFVLDFFFFVSSLEY